MAKGESLSVHHAKVRLLAGPLTEEEDPEMWAEVLAGHDHLAKWFADIGVEFVVHADYRIALVRQMPEAQRTHRADDTGQAVLPPALKSRALTFFESQVLTYLHEKLNTAASMGIYDLILLTSEVYDAIVNLQPEAQRNDEARVIKKIDAALKKFGDCGLLEEVQIGARPAIRPSLVLLVLVSRDELARFDALVERALGEEVGQEGGVGGYSLTGETDEVERVAADVRTQRGERNGEP
jgi:hypothetical protein